MNERGQVRATGCEIGRQHAGKRSVIAILTGLVDEGELIDISPTSQAVFGDSGIKCVISRSLHEQLEFFGESYTSGNTIYEEMLLDIKKSISDNAWFQKHIGSDDIKDIRSFLAHGRSAVFALEILNMPGFIVVVYPVPSELTLVVLPEDEAPASWIRC